MENKQSETKPWYKRTWAIVLFVILGLWFLISLGSDDEATNLNEEDIPDEYDILYSDYLNYHNTYIADIENLNALSDEWNEVSRNYNLYTNEGYITKLTEIANQYIDTYEYYQVHQQNYITFLEENKDDLEYSLENFSVVEQKREIEDNDISFRQTIQKMADDVNSLITSLEQQQSSEADIQSLKDLASLFTLLI